MKGECNFDRFGHAVHRNRDLLAPSTSSPCFSDADRLSQSRDRRLFSTSRPPESQVDERVARRGRRAGKSAMNPGKLATSPSLPKFLCCPRR